MLLIPHGAHPSSSRSPPGGTPLIPLYTEKLPAAGRVSVFQVSEQLRGAVAVQLCRGRSLQQLNSLHCPHPPHNHGLTRSRYWRGNMSRHSPEKCPDLTATSYISSLCRYLSKRGKVIRMHCHWLRLPRSKWLSPCNKNMSPVKTIH